jgi:hypothetical protein
MGVEFAHKNGGFRQRNLIINLVKAVESPDMWSGCVFGGPMGINGQMPRQRGKGAKGKKDQKLGWHK